MSIATYYISHLVQVTVFKIYLLIFIYSIRFPEIFSIQQGEPRNIHTGKLEAGQHTHNFFSLTIEFKIETFFHTLSALNHPWKHGNKSQSYQRETVNS